MRAKKNNKPGDYPRIPAPVVLLDGIIGVPGTLDVIASCMKITACDTLIHFFFMSNKIAIFGASGCIPGSEEYINATELGYQLASCGFDVVTGGYSGTMEAISLGASKIDNIKVCLIHRHPFFITLASG